ncbi:hypothetical protein LTR91_005401 [Friedmanniomyces endolithicus]|uniref:Uncharacterized protein n=1 Tax=Friedmanniomyces endolithicus TaxID=329885 RepID=A0AAN6KVD5_9PEZI|nr:hypothetical protein LTR94_000897 [Friedmanniomyces endolithicus]KAK0808380.1 hypothetical protein LTR59_002982 [Friedmanniomyces endolithicus]KAK0817821.1 hypothetical protein LTR38_001442 [Friedmanniomyces endolithicus]KAK0870772.1 hypothetical protein LTS02_002278 [Friedmanniomyces endolithicus]KAK0923134.1 hypothetical protein LTR57_007164 [Friedmanniomyces endolithicus]
MSSPQPLIVALWAPFIIPVLLIVTVLTSKLVSKYGLAALHFISTLKPAGITLLQFALIGCCITSMVYQAKAVWDYHSAFSYDVLIRSSASVYTVVGMITIGVSAIYIVEAVAAGDPLRSGADLLNLRPLSFAFLRGVHPWWTRSEAGDSPAIPLMRAALGEDAADDATDQGDATDGTDADEACDDTLVTDATENGEFHELRKADFEGWGPKPQ